MFAFNEGRAVDNCGGINYITIEDVRRSTAFVYNKTRGDKLLCDLSVITNNAWYRFKSDAGGEMPTRKPRLYSCSTAAPIWLNGSHPTVEQGTVTRKVCVYLPRVLPRGCGRSFSIKVRNCGDFYVYKLKQPKQCFLGYCAGIVVNQIF